MPEQQQACSGDAFRLCGRRFRDVDRVTTPADPQQVPALAGLSGVLQAGSEPDESAAASAGRPMAIKPAANKSSTKARKPKKPAET